MKVLLDSCVWVGVRDALIAAGHDVQWTGDWPEDPGDEEILAYAYRESRVLMTLDKDFGRLLFVVQIKIPLLRDLRQASPGITSST